MITISDIFYFYFNIFCALIGLFIAYCIINYDINIFNEGLLSDKNA